MINDPNSLQAQTNRMVAQLQAKEKQQDLRKKKQAALNEARVNKAAETGRKALKRDLEAGKELGADVVGEGLGRIRETEGGQEARALLQEQAQGLSSQQTQAMRESALERQQGSERAAERGLSSALARSGVKGGAAGQAQVELAAQSLQQRRALDRDIYLASEQARAQGVTNLAQFEAKTSEFDLAQAAKEKNIMLQSQLATAELGSNERSAVRAGIAAEQVAELSKRSGGKK